MFSVVRDSKNYLVQSMLLNIMWLPIVLISVCVCFRTQVKQNMLTHPTCRLVEHQCDPPLFHVGKMVCGTFIQYTFSFCCHRLPR